MQTTWKRLPLQLRQDSQMLRIAQIPGVDLLTAASAASTRNPRQPPNQAQCIGTFNDKGVVALKGALRQTVARFGKAAI